MEKKPRKNRKRTPLLVELTYQHVVDNPTSQQSVDRAFDVLFEEVLRRRRLRRKVVRKAQLTSSNN